MDNKEAGAGSTSNTPSSNGISTGSSSTSASTSSSSTSGSGGPSSDQRSSTRMASVGLRDIIQILWPELSQIEKSRLKHLLEQLKVKPITPQQFAAYVAKIVGAERVKAAAATLKARRESQATRERQPSSREGQASSTSAVQQQGSSQQGSQRRQGGQEREIVIHALHCRDSGCNVTNCGETRRKLAKMQLHYRQCVNTPQVIINSCILFKNTFLSRVCSSAPFLPNLPSLAYYPGIRIADSAGTACFSQPMTHSCYPCRTRKLLLHQKNHALEVARMQRTQLPPALQANR